MEGGNVVEVPEELQEQIMLRMPLKSLLKFICISKTWAFIIRGKRFNDLYLQRSMTRPRLLFAFRREIRGPTRDVLFHSVYQKEKPLLLSGQQQMLITSGPAYDDMSEPIQGLVCLKSQTKVVLCNPGTKTFRRLPDLGGLVCLKSYLGYDEDVFKVLCSTVTRSGSVMMRSTLEWSNDIYEAMQHMIFTVGSGEDAWRPVVCNYRHYPATNSLCKRGVLYYGAWAESDRKSIVVSFNVRSEVFTVIDQLPEGLNIWVDWRLVNYNDKFAFVDDPVSVNEDGDGESEIWVGNETAREWEIEPIEIPSWRETVGDMRCYFVGTIETGTLVFARGALLERSHYVVYYDTVTKTLRKFGIEIERVDGDPSFLFTRTFLDHVDSLWLTEGTTYS